MEKRKYGLDLEKELADQRESDWVFGSISPTCIASIPEDSRILYLPIGEVQRGREDMLDCASRAPVNILETKFNWLLRNNKITAANKKWLQDNGYIVDTYVQFSDAFVAINSNTTQSGNSLKAPLEAIRKQGLIPKSLLPFNPEMSWNEYHDQTRITQAMFALGVEFNKRFTINYERVYSENFAVLLDEDLIDVAGYAWPKPSKRGIYPRVETQPNHAFMAFAKPSTAIFDNYEEKSGDYIKQLAPDYLFLSYGYRVFITKQTVPTPDTWLPELLAVIKNLLTSWMRKAKIAS